MELTNKKYLIAVFAVLLPLYLLFTFDHGLWNPDETRDAGIARSMYVDKDFLVPRLNGEAFLEKPPLYYWTSSLIYMLTGTVNAGTTRLPAVLYGFLGTLFTFLIGRRFFNDRVGFMAAVFLGTSIQYFRMSHCALMDSTLAACVTGALYFFLIGNNFLFIIFAILAFYAKGFVAVAILGAIIGTHLLIEKKPKNLFLISLSGALIFLVAVGPWIYGLWKSGGREFLEIFFIHNNFQRFASKGADHANNPFFLYFYSIPVDFLPWTLLAIPAFIWIFKKDRFLKLPLPERFLCLWFLIIFVLLTLSSSKRSIYFMPGMPAVALITALWCEQIIQGRALNRLEKGFLVGTFVLLMLVGEAVFLGSAYQHKKYVLEGLGFLVLAYAARFVVRNLRKACTSYVFLGLVFIHVLSLVGIDIFFIKDLDQQKTFVPLCDEIKKDKERGALAGFQMSEMERGVFSFYLEKNIPNLINEEDLARFMAVQKEGAVLLTNKNNLKNLSDSLKKDLRVLYQYRPEEKSRSYVLYEINKKGS